MGLRRLSKISAQALSADADTPVYMDFCYIVGGEISPVLFNLYLHYTFDLWMKRHFPHIPFARYADDGVPRALNAV